MERIKRCNKILILIALTAFFCMLICIAVYIKSSAAEQQPLAQSIDVSGQAISVSEVMTIDGESVSLDEYRFYYLTQKAKMSSGNASYFEKGRDDQREEKLKSNTLQALLRDYAIRALARENGLKLSSAEKEQIQNDIDGQIRTLGGVPQYYQALAQVYMTDEIYQTMWKTTFCYEKLYQYYFGKDGTALTGSAAVAQNPTETAIQQDLQEERCRDLLEEYLDAKVNQMKISFSPEYDLFNLDTIK